LRRWSPYDIRRPDLTSSVPDFEDEEEDEYE
jgi:hypothetical protein